MVNLQRARQQGNRFEAQVGRLPRRVALRNVAPCRHARQPAQWLSKVTLRAASRLKFGVATVVPPQGCRARRLRESNRTNRVRIGADVHMVYLRSTW